jgi:hypothetical protein
VQRDQLTAEVVRELLDYDLETGLFTWKRRSALPAAPGRTAPLKKGR